jgi:hypothetical protein
MYGGLVRPDQADVRDCTGAAPPCGAGSRPASDDNTPSRGHASAARRRDEMSAFGIRGCLTALAGTVMLAGAAQAQMVVCPGGPCTGIDPSKPRVPQYVSPPDMALQFSTCLDSASGAFLASNVRDALVGAMQELDSNHDDPPPNPDVRHVCVNDKSTVGGWLRPVGSYGTTDTGTARNVGLSQVNLLVTGESFAFNFKPVGISRLVQIRWQDQPRRLDDDGNADPGGSVHLTGFNVFYQNADYYGRRIVDLAISGWYDGIQNTDIVIDIYDFMTVTQYGQLQCETYAEVRPTETTVDTILGSLTGGAGGSLGDVLGKGPGCQIANRLPRTVLIPQTPLKAVFTYTRVNSYQTSGVTFGGTWEIKNRQSWVDVQGPTQILAEPGMLFAGSYKAYPRDMRPPYFVSWTSLNATPVAGTAHATMTWSLPNLALGSQAQRTLTATVTDADNITVSGYQPVILKRVADSDPISPMCKAKPWLPQCQ